MFEFSLSWLSLLAAGRHGEPHMAHGSQAAGDHPAADHGNGGLDCASWPEGKSDSAQQQGRHKKSSPAADLPLCFMGGLVVGVAFEPRAAARRHIRNRGHGSRLRSLSTKSRQASDPYRNRLFSHYLRIRCVRFRVEPTPLVAPAAAASFLAAGRLSGYFEMLGTQLQYRICQLTMRPSLTLNRKLAALL